MELDTISRLITAGMCGSLLAAGVLAPSEGHRPRLSAREVILKQNVHYQSVMQDFELTKPKRVLLRRFDGSTIWVTRPFFGKDRLTPSVPGHGFIESEASNRKARREALASLEGWRDWVYLVGNKTGPLTSSTAKVSSGRAWGAILPGVKHYPDGADALALAKLALKAKEPIVWKQDGGFTMAAAKITFKDRRCLSCHSQSKLGDPAGVLFYAVHPDSRRHIGDREFDLDIPGVRNRNAPIFRPRTMIRRRPGN